MKEKFLDDLMKELNEVILYDNVDPNGKAIKTVECGTVCAILTVLLDKYYNN